MVAAVTLHTFGQHQIRVYDQDGTPSIAAIDLVEAIGLGNVTQATKHVLESEKSKLRIADGAGRRPPTTIVVLTTKGAAAFLASKASDAAVLCLAWFENELLPAIAGNLAPLEPDEVRAIARRVRPAEAPWNATELHYGNGTLYEDPEDRRIYATQRQIAGFAQVSVPMVFRHLSNIYADGDLDPALTTRVELIALNQAGTTVTNDGAGASSFLGRPMRADIALARAAPRPFFWARWPPPAANFGTLIWPTTRAFREACWMRFFTALSRILLTFRSWRSRSKNPSVLGSRCWAMDRR